MVNLCSSCRLLLLLMFISATCSVGAAEEGRLSTNFLEAPLPTPEQLSEVLSRLPAAPQQPATEVGVRQFAARWDCVAFVIGLLLITRSLGGLFRVMAGFSAGFALALFGVTWNGLPASNTLLEPLAALTVLFVGGGNLLRVQDTMFYAPLTWRPERNQRWLSAFVFGLVYGWIAAAAMRRLYPFTAHDALPLFSFGMAVGIGGLVLAVFPWLYILGELSQRFHRAIVCWSSAALVIVGTIWFAQRSGPLWKTIGELLKALLVPKDWN